MREEIRKSLLFKRIRFLLILLSLSVIVLFLWNRIGTDKLMKQVNSNNILDNKTTTVAQTNTNYKQTEDANGIIKDNEPQLQPQDSLVASSTDTKEQNNSESAETQENKLKSGVTHVSTGAPIATATPITGVPPVTPTSASITNAYPENASLATLKKDLETYIKKFSGKYGIYYYNLSNHEEFGINDAESFTAASTFKVPLNLYLYNKISEGKVNPQGLLTYIKGDYEQGTGKIWLGEVGKKFTIQELSKLSITISDNVATNMLLRYLGKPNVKQYMRNVGGTVVSDNKNISCPRDMGLYMKLVYEFYLNNKTYGKELMDYLLNTQFNDRLPARLPSKIKVAHKIGTQIRVINDVGIVFSPNPYIIAIMSKEVDEAVAPGVLAEISKRVYLYCTK